MLVRLAEQRDIAAIVALSRRVQDGLTARGSLQQIGPLDAEIVASHVAAGTAYLLAADGAVLGSVFVAPLPPHAPPLAAWSLAQTTRPLWFLEKLMIAPERQGEGLGIILLDAIKAHVAARGPATIVLDCWAGNTNLRDFYTRNGFHLHGVFPEDDYAVAVFTWEVSGE